MAEESQTTAPWHPAALPKALAFWRLWHLRRRRLCQSLWQEQSQCQWCWRWGPFFLRFWQEWFAAETWCLLWRLAVSCRHDKKSKCENEFCLIVVKWRCAIVRTKCTVHYVAWKQTKSSHAAPFSTKTLCGCATKSKVVEGITSKLRFVTSWQTNKAMLLQSAILQMIELTNRKPWHTLTKQR